MSSSSRHDDSSATKVEVPIDSNEVNYTSEDCLVKSPLMIQSMNMISLPDDGCDDLDPLTDDMNVEFVVDVDKEYACPLVENSKPLEAALITSQSTQPLVDAILNEDVKLMEISMLSECDEMDASMLQNNSCEMSATVSVPDRECLHNSFGAKQRHQATRCVRTPVVPLIRTTATQSETSCVAALPIDALHCIASFLKPREWCNGFGLTNKAALVQCREVIRRVRLHGFRCATEVVTAYKVGQIADSKELAALYIASGVPLYAACLGHSYHTLYWRIQVEHKQQQHSFHQQQTQQEELVDRPSSDSDDGETTPQLRLIDPYYSGRQEFRNRNWFCKKITYLEEKSLFYAEREESEPTSSHARSRRMRIATNSSERNSNSKTVDSMYKIPMPIHQHLIDRHDRGDIGVNDYDGKMKAPPVSLSAEFFHPSGKTLGHNNKQHYSNSNINVRNYGDVLVSPSYSISSRNIGDGYDSRLATANNFDPARADYEIDNGDLADNDENDDELEAFQPPPLPIVPIARLRSVLQSIQLQVYSSTSYQDIQSLHNPGNSTNTSHNEIMWHLRSRFATYQRRLESILSQCGSRVASLFEECLLDFWDEFFPHTADIHYHDTETAVPRLSKLKKFLTKPCPQAIGVVQCEIERVRIESRGKGVKMTGRFFPAYEYRLFIRNKQISSCFDYSSEDSEGNDNEESTRRDSLLMVAKHDTRRYSDTVTNPVRKGSNNYYLYMPNQEDIDDHYNTINNISVDPKRKPDQNIRNPNGPGNALVQSTEESGNTLLGRLQSRHMGTEFQIYTPTSRKGSQPMFSSNMNRVTTNCAVTFAEDELDYDSGVSSDTNSNPGSCRKSRFGRLSRRRKSTTNGALVLPTDVSTLSVMSDADSTSSSDQQSGNFVSRALMRRTFSSPDLSNQSRHQSRHQTRTNRRAIANSSDTAKVRPKPCYEEENGVITYTANLLGSRPRIMDVCVPKTTADGSYGLEWKKYLAANPDTIDRSRMLTCFRQLQQRRDAQDQGIVAAANTNANDATRNNINQGSSNQQENDSPIPVVPDDFGLLVLQNRQPWWNVELGSFVLNFGGRVSVASVKNFQLCERMDQEKVMLQFGRIYGRHSFTMDFQYPLTAVQAFSISISSLQSKLSFG
jgi:Tub family